MYKRFLSVYSEQKKKKKKVKGKRRFLVLCFTFFVFRSRAKNGVIDPAFSIGDRGRFPSPYSFEDVSMNQVHNNFSGTDKISRIPSENVTGKPSYTSAVDGLVRKASNLKWFKYRNICTDGGDRFVHSLRDNFTFSSNLKELALPTSVFVGLPDPFFDSDPDESRATYYLQGTSVFVSCWRMHKDRRQPSHFMFGYGKLFAMINDGLPHFFIDHVVFHQCPDAFSGHKTDFFHVVWAMLYRSGLDAGWFNSSTRFFSVGAGWPRNMLCAENMLIEHSVGRSLGQNHISSVIAWRSALRQYIRHHHRMLDPVSLGTGRYPSYEACKERLRISIFQRNEGKSLRKFVNLHDILSLSSAFSEHVSVVSLNSSSTFVDAVKSFNSFDILLTPHGSHLTNGLLIFEERYPIIIEVVATCVNEDFKKNLEIHFADYEISTGHRATDPVLRESISGCKTYELRNCSFSEECLFGNVRAASTADLEVDIIALRALLSRKVHNYCSTFTKHTFAWPFPWSELNIA